MRLADMVAQSPARIERVTPSGERMHVVGAGAFAERLTACPIRYVLDRRASRQCGALFCAHEGLPPIEDRLVRAPHSKFWLELHCDGEDEDEELGDVATGPRIGFLADLDEGGRRGRLQCFVETKGDIAALIPVDIEFDLDSTVPTFTDGTKYFSMRHAHIPSLDAIFARVQMIANVDTAHYARAAGETMRKFMKRVAEDVWYALPTLITFSALLNARNVLQERASDLSRLNVSRARNGRAALLDHVEVRLNLFPGHRDATGANYQANRRAARLHFVRGHQVHRHGKTFWRTSHYRGEVGPAPITTVSVTAGRGSHR